MTKSYEVIVGYESIERFADDVDVERRERHAVSREVDEVQMPVEHPRRMRGVQRRQQLGDALWRRMLVPEDHRVNVVVAVVDVSDELQYPQGRLGRAFRHAVVDDAAGVPGALLELAEVVIAAAGVSGALLELAEVVIVAAGVSGALLELAEAVIASFRRLQLTHRWR